MTSKQRVQGIQFPLNTKGERSSSAVGKLIVSKALANVDDEYARAAHNERQWRKKYPLHFRALVTAGIKSPDAALQIAKDGLKETWNQFQFVQNGHELSLAEAMTLNVNIPPRNTSFKSRYVEGTGSSEIEPWYVPYQGQRLSGEALIDQLKSWEQQGIIETSHRTALERVIAHPEWFDLSDRLMVLFGAASEAGPLTWLSKNGEPILSRSTSLSPKFGKKS